MFSARGYDLTVKFQKVAKRSDNSSKVCVSYYLPNNSTKAKNVLFCYHEIFDCDIVFFFLCGKNTSHLCVCVCVCFCSSEFSCIFLKAL